MTEAQQRERVLTAARSWIGTPWRHRSRVKGAGVDCAQLLIAAYSEAGVFDAFEPPEYAADRMLHSSKQVFQEICEQYGRKVAVPRPGDVVLWWFGKCFSHGGIVVDWPGRVIHAYMPYGQVCETPSNAGILDGRETVFYSFW